MSTAIVVISFPKRLRGLGPLMGLLSLLAACGDGGDHAGGATSMELNLLQSSCTAQDIATSGLAWECRGPCIAAPCDEPDVHLSCDIDTSTLAHFIIGSHGNTLPDPCDGFFFPPLSSGRLDTWVEYLEAVSETDFTGIMLGLMPCLGTEVNCKVVSDLPGTPSLTLDLLNSECLAGDIFKSGLTWRCEGTCKPVTCPWLDVRWAVGGDARVAAPECDQLVSEIDPEVMDRVRALSETDFAGFLRPTGCESLAHMSCAPASDSTEE